MTKTLLALLFYVLQLMDAFSQANDCKHYNDLAMDHYNKGEYASALEYFEKYADCAPTESNLYNVACAASRANQPVKGFAFLKKAITYGYIDSLMIIADSDLNNLHAEKEWQLLSTWITDAKNGVVNALSKFKSVKSSSNLIPYYQKGLWGYMDKLTRQKVTEPLFAKASFIGLTGQVMFGPYAIWVKSNGEVIRWENQSVIEEEMNADAAACRPVAELKKGFDSKSMTYASGYRSFQLIATKSRHFGIVAENGMFSLIDSAGNYVAGLNSLKSLMFQNCGSDFDRPGVDTDGNFLFFYAEQNNQAGYADQVFKKHTMSNVTDVELPRGNSFPEFRIPFLKFVYVKSGGTWGIWDCETKKWLIRPEYDKIIETNRTFEGDYENNLSRGNTTDVYFLVKKGKELFYIDTKNNKYRVP